MTVSVRISKTDVRVACYTFIHMLLKMWEKDAKFANHDSDPFRKKMEREQREKVVLSDKVCSAVEEHIVCPCSE
jgi:hypothetical protein